MPLTTSVRLVNPDNNADVQFCINAAAFANCVWDENTVRAYQVREDGTPSDNSRLFLLMAQWPERFSGSRRAAMCLGYKEGPNAVIQLLSIDPATIPDRIDTRIERRAAADRVMRGVLEAARDVWGCTHGKGYGVIPGSRMADYLATITGVTITTDAHGRLDYIAPIQSVINFLQGRSG